MDVHKIAVIAGDGVGPEVIAEGVKALNAVASLDGDVYKRQPPIISYWRTIPTTRSPCFCMRPTVLCRTLPWNSL